MMYSNARRNSNLTGKIYCVQCGKINYKESRICPSCAPLVRETMKKIRILTEAREVRLEDGRREIQYRYVQSPDLLDMVARLKASLSDKFDLKTGKSLTEVAEKSII